MRLAVLGSGSRGNSVVVESGGSRILLDAGFSARQIQRRLATLGLELSDVDAIVMTHEHNDHCQGADVLARRFGLNLWATAGTLERMALSDEARAKARILIPGWPFEVGGFSVEAFSIPHDAREPVGLVVEDGAGGRAALAADMGCRSQLAWSRLENLDVMLLEANHDLNLLRTGPYPWSVKQRIASRHGHLSNREAAEGLRELVDERLRSVVLYHLSQTNNSPVIAEALIGETLEEAGSTARVVVSYQDQPTPWIEVSA